MDRPGQTRSLRDHLVQGSRAVGVEVSDDLAALILKYLILLNKWSARINLVGTVDEREIVSRHIVDCLAVLPHIPAQARRLVDVGSGAGLPGAIIAMFRSELEVTALEPIHKKHAFLNALRRELPLPSFQPRATRMDELIKEPGFHRFDVAVSRATFALPEWLAAARSLVHAAGVIVAMEGSEKQPLPAQSSRHPYAIDDRTRAIIVCRP